MIGNLALGYFSDLSKDRKTSILFCLAAGVVGSFVGGPALNAIGINLGISNALASRIATSTIGAIIVVILARIIG